MNRYEQINYKGNHINIYYDEDALNPRQEFDHLGTLYTAHRRYQPEKDFDSNFNINEVFEGRIGDFRDSFLKQYVALPVYLYDHGATTIATTPFSCPWDSGFFGIIAVPLERIRKEFGWKHVTKARREQIEAYLQVEIEELDSYYTGEVYGYEISPEDDDKEVMDSCWGYYGSKCIKDVVEECKNFINNLQLAAA